MAVVIRKRSAAMAGSALGTQHSAVPRQLRPQARVIDLQWQLWAITARGTDGRTYLLLLGKLFTVY